MNKILAVAAALATLIPGSASAARFAVACAGVSQSENTVTKRLLKSAGELSTQTYVIDEEAKQVQRALPPRQEFETWCATGASGSGSCSVDISPGLIRVNAEDRSEAVTSTTELEFDRSTGTAEQSIKMEWADGRYHRLLWQMTCKPTPIPTFDRKTNRF